MDHHEEMKLSSPAIIDLITAVHKRGADFRFKASGWSMYPSIMDGDIITISPLKGVWMLAGDVVAFRHPATGKLVVHRVITVQSGSYSMKGDNSPEFDGVVARSNILGLVTKVEHEGHAIFWPDRRKWPKGAHTWFMASFAYIRVRKSLFAGLKYLLGVLRR